MVRKLNTTSNLKFSGQGTHDATDAAFTEPTFFGTKESGLTAGESPIGLGAFTNVALTNSRSTASGYKTDTDLGVVTLGIDKAFEDNFILGFAVSGSTSSATSRFEVGPDKFKSINGSTALSAAPYAALIIDEHFYIDATMGASGIENRLNHTAVPSGAVIQSGDGDAVSRFLGAAVNYIGVMGDFGLLASVGYTWSSTSLDEFRDDQGNLVSPDDERASQLIVSAEIGRPIGMFVPYVVAAYERDLIPSPRGGGLPGETAETAPNALRLGFGIDSNFTDNLVVSLEANTVLLKPGYDEVGLTFNLRYDF